MKYLTLDFFNDFACIGGACPNTCCAGWSISADSDSVSYYKSITGSFGDKLKENLLVHNGNTFFRSAEIKCPFLTAENLCEIYQKLGKEHMCQTCTDYPRTSHIYGDIVFTSLVLSCPEVARMLINRTSTLEFDFGELPDADINSKIDTSTDWNLFNTLISGLITSIGLLQNRTYSLTTRMGLLFLFNQTLQTYLDNQGDAQAIIASYSDPVMLATFSESSEIKSPNFSKRISDFTNIFRHWEKFENRHHLNPFCKDCEHFINLFLSAPEELLSNPLLSTVTESQFDIQYENYCVYYLFRYYMNAYKSRNLTTELSRLATLLNFQQCILLSCMFTRHVSATTDLQSEIFSATSRFFEHCPKNLELLDNIFVSADIQP